jgi:dienelactone hydrolase
MIELISENQKENRVEMIRQALKDKAPLMYDDLESSGQLHAFLEDREAEMMVYFKEAQERVWQETMSTFLDFFDPSYDETSSPM